MERIEKLLSENPEDLTEIEALVDEMQEVFEGDIYEYVFRQAVILGALHYVDAHTSDVDLNDDDWDGHSTYLDETNDQEMIKILLDSGAMRAWEDFNDFPFAAETINGYILAFNRDFQEDVLGKYLETRGLTQDQLIEIMDNYDEDDEDSLPEDFEFWTEDDFAAMGIYVEDGCIVFKDMVDENYFETLFLLEELGYERSFEGESWKLETNGVFYIEN